MEEHEQKQFRLALNSLKFLGYFDSPLLSKLYVIVYAVYAVVLFVGAVIGFMNRTTIQERIEIISIKIIMIFAFSYILNIYRQREGVEKFVSSVSQTHPIIDDLRVEALQLTVRRAAKVMPALTVLASCCGVNAAVSWCFAPLLDGFDYHNKNYYIFPYLYQCAENGENLFPLKSWCSNRETFLDFFTTNLLITIFTSWGSIPLCLFPLLFMICICIFIDANYTVIKTQLLQLEEYSSDPTLSSPKGLVASKDENVSVVGDVVCNDFAAKMKLIKVIQYHQYFLGTMKMICPLLESICDQYLINFVLNAAVMFYMMGNQVKEPGYWIFQIKISLVMSLAGAILFTNLYCAQVISDMQRNINDAVYFTPWYSQNLEFKKLLLQFQGLLQTPLEMKSLGMYRMNLHLFASSLRISYNILNLMLAQLKGK